MISQQQQIRWEVLLNQELDLKAFFNKQFRSEIKDPRYGKLKSMFNFLYEWKKGLQHVRFIKGVEGRAVKSEHTS